MANSLVKATLLAALATGLFGTTALTQTPTPTPSPSGYVFFETFANNNAGWTLQGEWQIGPATMSSGHEDGFPDPAFDFTATSDNGVAGIVIGGNAKIDLHDYEYLTSPEINASVPSGSRIVLQFRRWLNSDYSPWMENSVEVHDGSDWQTVWSSSLDGIYDNEWTFQEYDITEYVNGAIRIRFGKRVGALSAFLVSSWNIDDVAVRFAPDWNRNGVDDDDDIIAGFNSGLTMLTFSNTSLSGPPRVETASDLNYQFGEQGPYPDLTDEYSIRWYGYVLPEFSETYTFHLVGDDGVRLWVNGLPIIDGWVAQAPTEYQAVFDLSAGVPASIVLEYFELMGGAEVSLEWSSASLERQRIPEDRLFSWARDCNANNRLDTRDLSEDLSLDIVKDGILDICGPTPLPTRTPTPTPTPTPRDWNNNGQPDTVDISQGSAVGVLATYFNYTFNPFVRARIESTIDMFVDEFDIPVAGLLEDSFSVRWSGYLIPTRTALHTLYMTGDDGVRLWVNGDLLIDEWNDQSATTFTTTYPFFEGVPVFVVMEHFESGGIAVAKLEWSSEDLPRGIIPASAWRVAFQDCNNNGLLDTDDINSNNSLDTSKDGILDTCPPQLLAVITVPIQARPLLIPPVQTPIPFSTPNPASPIESRRHSGEGTDFRLGLWFSQPMDQTILSPNGLTIDSTQPINSTVVNYYLRGIEYQLMTPFAGNRLRATVNPSFFQSQAGVPMAVGDLTYEVRLLLGDANGDKRVTIADLALVKARVSAGSSVSSTNYQQDISGNETFDTDDLDAVKPQVGTSVD